MTLVYIYRFLDTLVDQRYTVVGHHIGNATDELVMMY